MRTTSQSQDAMQAVELIERLQKRFVRSLESVSNELKQQQLGFVRIEWLREDGKFGGGIRFESPNGSIFNAASVNFSHVHYESDESKSLRSATALSTIVHPENPFAPSVHIHLSWTEYKNAPGYWRVMADLNPAIESADQTQKFRQGIIAKSAPYTAEGFAQGEQYFWIPALSRHRGVVHFYLEEFSSGDSQNDLRYCDQLIGEVIDLYPGLVKDANIQFPSFSKEDLQKQLAYHTAYFLQVLTLDRGTTAGLLVHNQNDLGILGSLPARISRSLLKSWVSKHPSPQNDLVSKLHALLPGHDDAVQIDVDCKQRIADLIRGFYRDHPAALELQARGMKIPKTIANHSP